VRKIAWLMFALLLIGAGCGGGGGSTAAVSQIPTADAGTSRTVPVNVPVQLDGSKSASPNGGLLTYQWTLQSRPLGSTSLLNNGTVVNPTLTPDTTGQYVLHLAVNDGVSDSAVSSVTITAVAVNIAPVADAGPDRIVMLGIPFVSLDGSGSDDANGDPITYSWRVISIPAGSGAALQPLSNVQPDFTPDLVGNYIFGLTVTDNNAASSGEDTVTVTVNVGNVPPVADAGPDQNVATGAPVALDGSGSDDPNPADLLTYSWSMVSRPSGSGATLSDPLAAQTTFTADVSGSYVFALVVTDNGSAASDPSTVTISADRLASISVTPLDWLTTLGLSVQYSARGTYEIAGQKADLTNAVTWTSDDTSIATIDATGFAVTVSEGVTIIRTTYAGVSPFSTTLRVGAVSLLSIEILPASVDLSVGESTQLQLLGHRSDDSVIDLTNLADWTRSDSSVSVLTVGNLFDENKGKVTTFGTGAASVHATYQGLNADRPVNVTN